MNDYVRVLLIGSAVLFLLVFVPIWIGRAIRGPEQPTQPAPVPAAAQCGYYTECGNPATTERKGWPLCGDCAAELDARGRRVS